MSPVHTVGMGFSFLAFRTAAAKTDGLKPFQL
jgi:hypothetical protein